MPEKLIKKIRTSDGDYQIDYNALANLPDLSAVGAQSDFNQTDENANDFIKNKPELGQVASLDEIGKANLSAEVQEALDKIDAKASSIDLSAFESDGTIVETFADGSTKTTTMEFDADGNPIKITDAEGKVTVLTW
jgi:YD repeat-containing protein